MKVVRLEAENLKKLIAVDITPEGHVVEITGKNGAGKTSVLDAIWWALAGTSGVQSQPIRKGEERARIRLDLGDLVVTRRFTAQEDGTFTTTVIVENAEGARYPGPQAMLDAIVGKLTLDPLEFTRQPAKAQFETLKRLTGLDFTELEAANRADYDKRTEHNRRAKQERGTADLIRVPDDATVEKIDVSDILEEIEGAASHNLDVERRRANRANAEDRVTVVEKEIIAKREQIAAIQAQIGTLTEEMNSVQQRLASAGALPDPIEVSELRQKAADAQAQNETAEQLIRKRASLKEAEHYEHLADGLTEAMDVRAKEKVAMIAAAQMPVEGLGFGDDVVTLSGLPFDQASDAEQLRASIAIAAAANPKLRVIRVRDGSLLDEDSFALLTEFAAAHDLQVWVETVQSGRPGAILIEDGHIAEPKPAKGAKAKSDDQGALL